MTAVFHTFNGRFKRYIQTPARAIRATPTVRLTQLAKTAFT